VTATDKPNPFMVLQLRIDAANEDIVARGQQMSDLADTDEHRVLCRWAMEQLITHPSTRLAWELFEVPDTAYRDDAWERFVKSHRRNPIDQASLLREAEPPRIDDFNLALLARLLADALLTPPDTDLAAIITHAPAAFELGPPPVEVKDVIFG
jgi:hypothetical protein